MKKELPKSFAPVDIENKWYEFWESKGYYQIGQDRYKARELFYFTAPS